MNVRSILFAPRFLSDEFWSPFYWITYVYQINKQELLKELLCRIQNANFLKWLILKTLFWIRLIFKCFTYNLIFTESLANKHFSRAFGAYLNECNISTQMVEEWGLFGVKHIWCIWSQFILIVGLIQSQDQWNNIKETRKSLCAD